MVLNRKVPGALLGSSDPLGVTSETQCFMIEYMCVSLYWTLPRREPIARILAVLALKDLL